MRIELNRFIFFNVVFFCFLSHSGFAQNLMSYGGQTVSKAEFLKAYRKNNIGVKPTGKSYQEYLELYTRYKLKVRAAIGEKLDTIPTLIAELQNFRNQVADTYMHDDAFLEKLTTEAFNRSQKDIHVAQIYIASPLSASVADSIKAFSKLTKCISELKSGKDFGQVAAEYSDDPFAKTNRGDISYITLFSLPYELENLAYHTSPGKFSAPYRSKNGYHIFKNLGERKALGRVRAAQILLIFPISANESAKMMVKLRADSLYNALVRGSDFGEMAKQFSGDNLSYQSGGEMPEFGVGKYDPIFENATFALTKNGEISKPVMTSFGYHIIKRLSRIPVVTEKTKTRMDALKQQVMNDSRIDASKKAMTQKIMQLCQFKENTFNENELWAFTDSSLQNKPAPQFAGLNESTVVFTLRNKSFTVKDWVNYRNSIRNILALTRDKSNRGLLDQYEQSTALDYYRGHLENYNPEFAYQLNEFRDGNLLFEIMQRKVWDKATADSIGLKDFYNLHKNNYWWESSAEAVLFTCSNEHEAEVVKKSMHDRPHYWRRLVDSSNGLVQADSGRFELSQLPAAEQGKLQAGQCSSMIKNQADNSITIAYIIKLYPDHMLRNYSEARGLAINDYQTYLEDQWIIELKKKYPVSVDQTVLANLPK